MSRIIDTLLEDLGSPEDIRKQAAGKATIQEMPLPADWDESIFASNVPFRKKLDYARRMARRLATGSSRVAFIIPYEGRNTVLKVARNEKGMAQNAHEIKLICDDYYLRDLEITIPCIDYDTKNPSPTWIHTEFARKVSLPEFRNIVGGTPSQLVNYALNTTNKHKRELHVPKRLQQVAASATQEFLPGMNTRTMRMGRDVIDAFVDLVGSYNINDIMPSDLDRTAQWGIYKDKNTGVERLVIIDIGLSYEILRKHYAGNIQVTP